MENKHLSYLKAAILFLITVSLTSCDCTSILSGTGTHGSIKTYKFAVSKDSLEKSILQTIRVAEHISMIDVDMTDYIGVNIISSNFIIRFSGDESYWRENPNESYFFIAYYKKEHDINYKSEGDISRESKKKAIKVFEDNFIKALEVQTGLKPEMGK